MGSNTNNSPQGNLPPTQPGQTTQYGNNFGYPPTVYAPPPPRNKPPVFLYVLLSSIAVLMVVGIVVLLVRPLTSSSQSATPTTTTREAPQTPTATTPPAPISTPTTQPVVLTTPVTAPTPTPTPTPQPQSQTPPCPTTADAAATVLGVDASLLSPPAAGCGWHVDKPVSVKVYPALCVDIPSMSEAQAKGVITGTFSWVGQFSDHSRVLMQSAGSVIGPTTVYWGACPAQ